MAMPANIDGEHWAAERTRMETVLDAMRHGLDAAAAAQDAHHSLADARAAAERYARLHVARELLRSGIDRFRRSQQGPLLQAAGRHFATLTGNRPVFSTPNSDTTAGKVRESPEIARLVEPHALG